MLSGPSLPQVQSSAQTSPQDFNPKYHAPFHPKIGKAQFHSVPIVYNKRMTFLNHTIVSQLSSQTLTIPSFYMYWRWQFLFTSIDKMAHQRIDISENYYPNVLKDIVAVQWARLKIIKLNLPNTTSIEPVSWLDCPHLEKIELIVRVINIKKPFTKAMFAQLSSIKVGCDSIGRVDLSRVYFAHQQPLNIDFEVIELFDHKAMEGLQNYCFMAKVGHRGHLPVKKRQKTGPQQNAQQSGNRQKRPPISSMVVNKMLSRMTRRRESDQNQNKHQGQKVMECLLKRKFQVQVQDQVQAQVQVRVDDLQVRLGGQVDQQVELGQEQIRLQRPHSDQAGQ